jgi:hypothetical protein
MCVTSLRGRFGEKERATKDPNNYEVAIRTQMATSNEGEEEDCGGRVN